MSETQYTREDFSSQTEVRWCPGCGDYAILMALQKLLAEIGEPPEKHVFISGIGCAGRLPYYMNAYGFHTIHGRATAVATGLKAMRDDLHVWVITGDGDALSIGGNHLIHCLRRNVNVNILLFNNQIYGLTKGQFSPTSQQGLVTKTSPRGVSNTPVNPLQLALAAGAGFVARSVDKDPVHLIKVLKKAWTHRGASFVEIYQDCNIFNHGVFDGFALKSNRPEHTLILEEGKPMNFGGQAEWSLELKEDILYKKSAGGASVLKHDPDNFLMAMRLASLFYPEFPVPMGVFYQQEKPEFSLSTTIKKTQKDVEALFKLRASWEQA